MQRLREQDWDAAMAASTAAVVFWAEWCLPSRTAVEALERAAGHVGGRLRAFAVDVEESPGLADRCGVVGLPTLLVFERGSERARRIGLLTAEDLARLLDAGSGASSRR